MSVRTIPVGSYEMMDKLHADGIGRLPWDKHGCTRDFQVVFFIGILYLLKVVEKRSSFCESSLFTVTCYIMYDMSDDLDKWDGKAEFLKNQVCGRKTERSPITQTWSSREIKPISFILLIPAG